MKKKHILIVFLFMTFKVFCQVPADSLTGIYAGQYWVADPYLSPWVITPDTVYVSSIDSINCRTYLADQDTLHFYGYPYYYTAYYSCNDSVPAITYNTKFYSNDSLRILIDDEPRPFPQSPWSWHFYGKKISNYTVVNNLKTISINVTVFPNPANKEFTVKFNSDSYNNCIVKLFNYMGQEVFLKQKPESTENIDASMLPAGMYVINIYGNNFSKTEKVIIAH